MKHIIVVVLILSVIAVNAQNKKQSRKEKKAQETERLTQQTRKIIKANNWQFNATYMHSSAGSSRVLTTPYYVQLATDTVDSYLPYFGRAYTAEYGSISSPMIFEEAIADYMVDEAKKNGYIIRFSVKNKNDWVQFTFQVTATGSATLGVNSTNRQHISYHGYLSPIEATEKDN